MPLCGGANRTRRSNEVLSNGGRPEVRCETSTQPLRPCSTTDGNALEFRRRAGDRLRCDLNEFHSRTLGGDNSDPRLDEDT